MKLSFEELLKEAASFEGDFSFGDGDIQVDVKGYQANFLPTDAGVYADISFDFEFSYPCDRCLEPTKGFGANRSGIQLMKQPDGMKDEISLGDDDMGIVYLESDEIDLEEMVKQEVVYHLPVRLVCGDDCKGLCSQCGENLNLGKCKCEAVTDPRWASLKDIKKS